MHPRRNSSIVLPLHFFAAGRPCTVAGAGRTAWPKIRLLLEAGAKVRVVAPELTAPEAAAAAREGAFEHVPRRFEAGDARDAALVFAATGSRTANREILRWCRAAGTPCACVDGNWAQGDFTVPATARVGELTVTVTAGGTDGRQARLICRSIERHLRMMTSARLVVVGTDHRHMSIEEREPFHLTGERFEQAGFMIMQLWGIHEFMLLNTCNRVEIVAVVSEETSRNGILRHILGFSRLKEGKFYLLTDEEAFEHLCLTTAGMLSQTPGENHVAAQVKKALETAREHGWAGGLVQEWVSSALRVSREIKRTVSPFFTGCEIEDLALRRLEEEEGLLDGNGTVLVLGTGEVGRALVEALAPRAEKVIWCYHRNRPAPPAGNVACCSLNELKSRLGEADAVVCAMESSAPLLHAPHAPFFNAEKPVLLIDLGMPRNVDPELDRLVPALRRVDLDALKYHHRRRTGELDRALAAARAVVRDHHDLYERIADTLIKNGHAAEPAGADPDPLGD